MAALPDYNMRQLLKQGILATKPTVGTLKWRRLFSAIVTYSHYGLVENRADAASGAGCR